MQWNPSYLFHSFRFLKQSPLKYVTFQSNISKSSTHYNLTKVFVQTYCVVYVQNLTKYSYNFEFLEVKTRQYGFQVCSSYPSNPSNSFSEWRSTGKLFGRSSSTRRNVFSPSCSSWNTNPSNRI